MKSNSGSNVLICHHDANYRNDLSAKLRSPHLSVDQASSGFQAIKMVEENNYRLVLLSEKLQDLGGKEISLMLRSKFNPEKLSILIITYDHTEENQKECKDMGADHCSFVKEDKNKIAQLARSLIK